MIAGVTMLVGISTFAVVTAKVAQFLVRSENQDVTDSDACGAPKHESP
jgi:hypothetical protein